MGNSQPIAVPSSLSEAVAAWQRAGMTNQDAVRWNRKVWTDMFPDLVSWLATVPDRISRDDAARLAADATQADGAKQAFVASMIWGYGPVGYGAWRTRRVLTSTDDSVERLVAAASAIEAGGPLQGFRALRTRPIRYLGVAFGTKYLYFVSKAVAKSLNLADGELPAPVLDAVVRRWLGRNARVNLRIDSWDVRSYERYLELLDQWGSDLGLPRDQVEELIFRAQFSADDSPLWREAEFAIGSAARDALEMLQQLEETLEELPGDSSALAEAAPHLEAIRQVTASRGESGT